MTKDEKDIAGVVAPPPLIFLGGLLIGLVLDAVRPLWSLPDAARLPAAVLLIAVGAAIIFGGFRWFGRAGTPVDPRQPTSALVVTGLYRWSRNPIYVAVAAIYLGLTAAFGGVWTLVMLGPVLAVIRLGVIAREERYLEVKFGDEYRQYKASVRRWL